MDILGVMMFRYQNAYETNQDFMFFWADKFFFSFLWALEQCDFPSIWKEILTQRIHVWHINLHLAYIYSKDLPSKWRSLFTPKKGHKWTPQTQVTRKNLLPLYTIHLYQWNPSYPQ